MNKLYGVMRWEKNLKLKQKEKLNYDGISLAENNGLGQEVKHFHLHLIPRYHNEEKLSIEEVYNKIK